MALCTVIIWMFLFFAQEDAPKVVKYMRQLAVITPYAHMELTYTDEDSSKKSFTLNFARRSDQMPPAPTLMKHHPSSVNNLLVEDLISKTKQRTLKAFLHNDFSCMTKSHAERLLTELGDAVDMDEDPKQLQKKQIHQLTQLLKEAKFAKPDSKCLSPAGEYNLSLGIRKEIASDLVATGEAPAGVYEGHPFVVQAAVAIGGKGAKPGITVYRFANRIPLLFEPGSDVVSQVANKGIKWGAYKIKNTDKIGVFVSLVSTKIPFKGTSKEYIGDDNGPLRKAVVKAIQLCCVQLKKKLVRMDGERTLQNRKKSLTKYIPDVTRALMTVWEKMADADVGSVSLGPLAKRPCYRADENMNERASAILQDIKEKRITHATLEERLHKHVDQIDSELALEYITSTGRRAGTEVPACIMALQPEFFGAKQEKVYHPHACLTFV